MAFGGWIGATGTRGPIDVVGLRRQHNKWLAEQDLTLDRFANEIGESAIHFAATTKAVKRRTGALSGGWKKRTKKTKNRITVSLTNAVKHALFQEHGTGLYGPKQSWIVPKRAPLLRWKNPDTGRWCSARRVRGVKPKFIGKHGAFEAWGFGKGKLTRRAATLAGKF